MSSRDRSLLAVLVLIIAAVGGYFLIVQPKHHQADQVQVMINAEQTALGQAESTVQTGLAAEAKYKIYARQLKAISAAIPGDTQIPDLINQLQAASTKNKVLFQAVTPGAAPAAAAAVGTAVAFPSESFSLSFQGTYFSVADLLGTLDAKVRADDKHFEASGRLISISTVGLAPNGTSSGNVTASITALDYDVPTALLTGATTTSNATP